MARFFNTIIALSLLLLVSCQEAGEAGDLFGQWRLADSDTKYVSFSGSLTLFRSISEGEVYGKFQHVGDSLFIQCLSIYGVPSDTAIVEKSFGFQPFGDIRLRIEALSNDKIVLSKGQRQWKFRKY